uniref:Uncharacterized protein n=1 Tax=Astatotilapia calliptera TaxID=8154 RepID=A0AAX7T8M0_ASTCA
MDQCEGREEGIPPSKTTLCGEHKSPTKAQRKKRGTKRKHEPEPSCVSLKSDGSKDHPLIYFKVQPVSAAERGQRSQSAGSSCPSVRSDWSKDDPPLFSAEPGPTRVDQESSESSEIPSDHLDSIFMLLEDNIITFVKNELKKIQKVLSPGYPECLESQREDDEQKSSREAFLKITVVFLRRMKREELANRKRISKGI